MTSKTVKEIVVEYLKANGYGGLYSVDGSCACALGDLAPLCGYAVEDCRPGVIVAYPDHKCPCGQGCDFHVVEKEDNE